MPRCPFKGGEDDEFPYTMLLKNTDSLYFVCPCPDRKLEAEHRALTSEGKQLVPKKRRSEPWHVQIVKELTKRRTAAAAAK